MKVIVLVLISGYGVISGFANPVRNHSHMRAMDMDEQELMLHLNEEINTKTLTKSDSIFEGTRANASEINFKKERGITSSNVDAEFTGISKRKVELIDQGSRRKKRTLWSSEGVVSHHKVSEDYPEKVQGNRYVVSKDYPLPNLVRVTVRKD